MADAALTIGRVVRYTLPDGHGGGQERPAIIVNATPDLGDTSVVNLVVFLDGDNDDPIRPEPTNHTQWRERVPHDPDGRNGTWRWPPRT